MKTPSGGFTSIGGQAVIEGVMMRSPNFIAVAVRKPNQKIQIRYRPYVGLGTRYPLLKQPILRGVVALLESMAQGMQALSYSAEVASQLDPQEAEQAQAGDETGSSAGLSSWAIASSMIFAIGLGLGLFVALPHFLTALITGVNQPSFHLIDGLIKMGILLLYVSLISLMQDIRRVFQYHGAEHQSIYAFEAGLDLTVANAKIQSTLHPRCGTSFLLFLVVVSILVFSVAFPLFGLTQLSPVAWLNHGLMVVVKIFLMLPVAGIAYEFIKACAFRMNNPVFRLLIWPGLMLQNLTTRVPDDDQTEVALASLRQVLLLEKAREQSSGPQINASDSQAYFRSEPLSRGSDLGVDEIEIAGLSDLATAAVEVSQFPEL